MRNAFAYHDVIMDYTYYPAKKHMSLTSSPTRTTTLLSLENSNVGSVSTGVSANKIKQIEAPTKRPQSQEGYIMAFIIKCGMKLLIHTQTSTEPKELTHPQPYNRL